MINCRSVEYERDARERGKILSWCPASDLILGVGMEVCTLCRHKKEAFAEGFRCGLGSIGEIAKK